MEGVAFVQVGGSQGAGVLAVGEEGKVAASDGDEGWVELDARDALKGMERGGEHGAAFAGANVEECVPVDRQGRPGSEPEVDEAVEDGRGDAVVGGEVGVAGVSGEDGGSGEESAGVCAVEAVERVHGYGWRGWDGACFSGHG